MHDGLSGRLVTWISQERCTHTHTTAPCSR